MSTNSYNSNGDINSGRGQLGLCVFYNATVASIEQSVIPVPTSTNPFTDYFNKYILTSTGNLSFKLNIVGTTDSDVQPGYTCVIVNKNSAYTISITDSSSGLIYNLQPNYQITLIAQVASDTWCISDIAFVDPSSSTKIISLISTTNATPTTILTLPTISDTGYNISNSIVCYANISGDSAGFTYNISAKNTGGTVSIIDTALIVNGRTNNNLSMNTIVSGTNLLIQVVGLAITNINWKAETVVLSIV